MAGGNVLQPEVHLVVQARYGVAQEREAMPTELATKSS